MAVNAVFVGIGIGILSSLMGIGGGPVLIPILLYLFHLTMPQAAGTSLAVIIPTAVVGLIGHYQKGNVNLNLAVLIALGGMVGAYVGTYVSGYIPAELLKKGFAILLIYIAIRMLLPAKV